MHGMKQLEEPLERLERRRAHVLLLEPRLDRLEVPVAEVVEREVVQPLAAWAKSKASRSRSISALVASIRARIQRSSTDDGRASGSTAPAISRSRLAFQSLFASFRPSSIVPKEKRGSWLDVTLSSP